MSDNTKFSRGAGRLEEILSEYVFGKTLELYDTDRPLLERARNRIRKEGASHRVLRTGLGLSYGFADLLVADYSNTAKLLTLVETLLGECPEGQTPQRSTPPPTPPSSYGAAIQNYAHYYNSMPEGPEKKAFLEQNWFLIQRDGRGEVNNKGVRR